MSHRKRVNIPAAPPDQALIYGGAVAGVALATLLRWRLDPLLNDSLPFVTYLAAILFAAWFGGSRPALLSLLLSILASVYWFAEPRGSLVITDSYRIARLGVDISVAVITIGLMGQLRTAKRRAEENLKQLDAELQEREIISAALRESEERFRVALQDSGHTVFMQDTGLRYTWIYNPVEGFEPGDILGKTDLELHAPGAHERLTEIKRRVMETQRGITCEVEVELGGRTLIYEMTLEPLRNAAGSLIGLTGAAHDITDRKRVERALRESEERLRIILENMPIMVIGAGDDQAPVFWNRECERVTGYSASEILGNTRTNDLLYPDPAQRKRLARKAVARTGSYEHWVAPLTTKDGTTRIIAWTNLSKRYPIPGWSHWMIGIDVTERYKAQDRANRLQAITEKLSGALTPDDIAQLITSPDFAGLGAHLVVIGLIGEANKSLHMTSRPGTTEDMQIEFRELPLDTPNPMTDCVRMRQPVWIESAEAYWECYPELAAQTLPHTGTQSIACLPLMVEGRVLGGIGWSFPRPNTFEETDRSFLMALANQCAQALERTRLYDAEARSRRDAEKASELKSMFLAMISHELRTPLTSIKGFTTTLLAPDVQWGLGEQREFIEIINTEAEKLNDLVEQLLDVSTLQAGTLRISRSPLRLTNIVEISRAQLISLAQHHELSVDIPQDLPPILADGQRIAQVIGNLVENAVKYSPLNTQIRLTARQREGLVQIDVADEGYGIPRDERSEVFEAFRQGADTRVTQRRKGVGLGLAICKGLVEAHGGMIWIEDQDERGTIISFTVPVAADITSSERRAASN